MGGFNDIITSCKYPREVNLTLCSFWIPYERDHQPHCEVWVREEYHVHPRGENELGDGLTTLSYPFSPAYTFPYIRASRQSKIHAGW